MAKSASNSGELTGLFPQLRRRGFDVMPKYHAEAILRQDFPEAAAELERVLREIAIPIEEIVGSGGGESKGTQRLRRALSAAGWRKDLFRIEKTINKRSTYGRSHEVDHVKSFDAGTIVLEVEWNNKEPFFDRDLENFSRLHGEGAISVALIVTRGSSLQDSMLELALAFAKAASIEAFDSLRRYDAKRHTEWQEEEVASYVTRHKCSFGEAWATCFVRGKCGSSPRTGHSFCSGWIAGLGSPCPLIAVGLSRSVVGPPRG